jgi:hypothetical protein
MRGYDQFNFPAFHRATAELRALDHEVISPAEHDEEIGFDSTLNSLDGFDLHASMRWDVGQVLLAEMVCVLPGWENSEGTKIEVAVAKGTGVPVVELAALVAPELAASEAAVDL